MFHFSFKTHLKPFKIRVLIANQTEVHCFLVLPDETHTLILTDSHSTPQPYINDENPPVLAREVDDHRQYIRDFGWTWFLLVLPPHFGIQKNVRFGVIPASARLGSSLSAIVMSNLFRFQVGTGGTEKKLIRCLELKY